MFAVFCVIARASQLRAMICCCNTQHVVDWVLPIIKNGTRTAFNQKIKPILNDHTRPRRYVYLQFDRATAIDIALCAHAMMFIYFSATQ